MTRTLKLGIASISLIALCGVATPAMAQQSTSEAKPAPTAKSTTEMRKKYMGKHVDELPETTSSTKAVQNRNEIVCKKIKKTGSRLGARKVCATKQEWDNMKGEAKRLTRDKQVTRYSGS